MNINEKLLICCFILLSVFFIPYNINAHPGRTASDGCHYCRTNCSSWGVAWNQRHCHNAPAPTISKPSSPVIPKSGSNPESKSINIDIPKQESPRSAYTSQIQDKTDKSNNWILWLMGIVVVGGIGLVWIRKK